LISPDPGFGNASYPMLYLNNHSEYSDTSEWYFALLNKRRNMAEKVK